MATTLVRRSILSLGVLALALAPALAHPRGMGRRGPGPGGPHRMLEHMTEALGLTEEQQGRVREIVRASMEGALGAYLDALHQARERLDDAIHDPSLSEGQVREAAQAVSAQATVIAVERHRMVLEIHEVLSAEQRQKAALLRQQPHPRHHGSPWERPDAD